jgi:hypothetical protein
MTVAFPRPKRSKYGNVKVTIDGHTFDSKREALRYQELRVLEAAGKISHLELQPTFKLYCGQTPIKFASGRHATYKADFAYFDYSRAERLRVVEDVKGFKTDVYKLKKAIVEACYPGVKIVEI